jgi:hypothetical protein
MPRVRCFRCALAALASIVALASSARFACGQDAKGIGVVGAEDALRAIDPTLRPPRRFALLIGVGAYDDARIVDLPACERDATELAAVLRDPAVGLFPADAVTVLTDAQVTRTSVVEALDGLARRAGPDDLVIVFFSGHGATDEKGRAYWIMRDTRIDQLRSTALAELEISELLAEIRTRRLVTIIDACYSAATAEVRATKSLPELAAIYPEFRGEGRVGLTGSKGNQLSIVITDRNDPGFGHSAFTFHVIEGLRGHADARGNGDGIIELDELWSFVKDRTVETARRQGGHQEPQLKGQMGSRFLLAIDAERLRALAEVRDHADRRIADSLEALKRLLIDDRLSAAEFEEGRVLLRREPSSLDERERARRDAFVAFALGRVDRAQFDRSQADAQPAVPAAPTVPKGATASDWPASAASLAARFGGAPVAVSLDLRALGEDPAWSRFAAAFARWPAAGDTDAACTADRSVFLFEPFPATSDATVLMRGAIRHHRADPSACVAEVFAHPETVTKRIDERITLSIVGDEAAADALRAKPDDGKPAMRRAVESILRHAPPIGIAFDGPWLLERLEFFGRDPSRLPQASAEGPAQQPGGLFVGAIYESLSLADSPELAERYAAATSGLQSASVLAEPTGPWTRLRLRLDFGTPDEADRAAPGWRIFLSRLPAWSDSAVRPLDVQVEGASLHLRCDVRTERAIAWIDTFLALPGSARERP